MTALVRTNLFTHRLHGKRLTSAYGCFGVHGKPYRVPDGGQDSDKVTLIEAYPDEAAVASGPSA